MKRKSTKNKSKKNNNNVLISKNINLNTSSVTINVISTVPLYYYNTTPNISFSTGADLRYYGFPSILAGTYPFVDLATVYSDFRINSASIVVTPYANVAVVLPPLHVTCDPDGVASNPVNTTVIASPMGRDFNLGQLGSKSAHFSFIGTDKNVRIWTDTASAGSIAGAFYFGVNTTNLSGTTGLAFELSLCLNVSFRGVKGN